MYEQSSGQRVDRLMEEFFSNEKVKILHHTSSDCSEVFDELKRIVKTELPLLLLMSRIILILPPEYFGESIPLEKRTVNKLKDRLRLIEMRLQTKNNEITTFAAKGETKGGKKKFDKTNKEVSQGRAYCKMLS